MDVPPQQVNPASGGQEVGTDRAARARSQRRPSVPVSCGSWCETLLLNDLYCVYERELMLFIVNARRRTREYPCVHLTLPSHANISGEILFMDV